MAENSIRDFVDENCHRFASTHSKELFHIQRTDIKLYEKKYMEISEHYHEKISDMVDEINKLKVKKLELQLENEKYEGKLKDERHKNELKDKEIENLKLKYENELKDKEIENLKLKMEIMMLKNGK
jgi:hypothetical protein